MQLNLLILLETDLRSPLVLMFFVHRMSLYSAIQYNTTDHNLRKCPRVDLAPWPCISLAHVWMNACVLVLYTVCGLCQHTRVSSSVVEWVSRAFTSGCGFTFVREIIVLTSEWQVELSFLDKILVITWDLPSADKRFKPLNASIHKKYCDGDSNLLTATGAAAQKEQLCVGEAEVGVSRGECFHSVQNNSWLPDQHWKASDFFFFFFPVLLLHKRTVVQEYSSQSSYSNTHGNAFGSDNLTVKAAPGRIFMWKMHLSLGGGREEHRVSLLLIKEVSNIPVRRKEEEM